MAHSDGTVSITVNGEHKRVAAGLSLADLANELGLVPEKVAVERNLEVVPRSTLADVRVDSALPGDEVALVCAFSSASAQPLHVIGFDLVGQVAEEFRRTLDHLRK